MIRWKNCSVPHSWDPNRIFYNFTWKNLHHLCQYYFTEANQIPLLLLPLSLPSVLADYRLPSDLPGCVNYWLMDLTQFYGCTYWHYDSASVQLLRTPFLAGTKSSPECLLLIILLSDARMFLSQWLQAQFVKNVKDLHPPCFYLLHPSCCLVSNDSSSPHSC